MAEELVKKCPVNVFDIEDIAKGEMKLNQQLSCNCYHTSVWQFGTYLSWLSIIDFVFVLNYFIDHLLGRKRATVARPRSCTLCRECIRGDGWEKLVALRRVKDHFICK